MKYFELVMKIEGILQKSISKCIPRNWNEDYITRTILTDLKNNLNNICISNMKIPVKINFDVFKLSGSTECKHGDIAVFVKHESYNKDTLKGVGFLEAKRIYKNRTFKALKIKQLKRIANNTNYSYTLLYDKQSIADFSDNIIIYHPSYYYNPFITLCTNTAVMQSNTVIKLNRNDTELYKYTTPFSFQLCNRYFRGYDLDYDITSLEDLMEFMQKKEIEFDYIVIASIGYGVETPELTEDMNFLLDSYERI